MTGGDALRRPSDRTPMNTGNSNKEDPPLRDLLKEWDSESPLPPRFHEQVWQRIDRDGAVAAPSASLAVVLANWLTDLLPRPALAVGYVAALLAIGASVGWSHARQETARVTDALSTRYVHSIDPYRTTP